MKNVKIITSVLSFLAASQSTKGLSLDSGKLLRAPEDVTQNNGLQIGLGGEQKKPMLQDISLEFESEKPEKEWVYFDQGAALKQDTREYNAAVDFNTQAQIQENNSGDDYKAYNDRADAYFRLGRLEESLQGANKAIEVAPKATKGLYASRARIFEAMGLKAEMLKDIDAEIEINPNVQIYQKKINVLSDDKNHKDIITTYEDAVQKLREEDVQQLIETYHIHYKVASAYEQVDRKKEALAMLQKATKIDFLNPSEWTDSQQAEDFDRRMLKAHLEIALEDYQAADKTYFRALARHLDNPDYASELFLCRAKLYNQMDDTPLLKKNMIKALDLSLQFKESREAYLMRSELYFSLGQYNNAFEDYILGHSDMEVGIIAACAAVLVSVTAVCVAYGLKRSWHQLMDEPRQERMANMSDVNETYEREVYIPSVKNYAVTMLHWVANFEDMQRDENGALQQKAIEHYGKEKFTNLMRTIFDFEYNVTMGRKTEDGQEYECGKLAFGAFNQKPAETIFVRLSPCKQSDDTRLKSDSLKGYVDQEVKGFLDKYVDKMLRDVRDGKEKECLKSMLLDCLIISNQCDIIVEYYSDGRQKNVLYDRIAKSGDYTKVDVEKLKDAKVIFKEAARDYFEDLYAQIIASKDADKLETLPKPQVKVNHPGSEVIQMTTQSMLEKSTVHSTH